MYIAKSLTGHIYEYSPKAQEVQEAKEDLKEVKEVTVADFLSDIVQRNKVQMDSLHLLDPDTEEELSSDHPLRADHVYLLLADTPLPQLLPWLTRDALDITMLLHNPAYPLTPDEVASLTIYDRNLIAGNKNPESLALLEPYLQYADDLFEDRSQFDPRRRDFRGLDKDGWRILCLNEAAIPLLEAHYELVLRFFPHIADHLALNEAAIPLLTRLLADPRTPDVRRDIMRPRSFQRNIVRNPAAMPLLEQYPYLIHTQFREGEIDTTSGIFINPGAIDYITDLLRQHPDLEDRLPWRALSALEEAIPLLRAYPHRIAPTITMNADPAALEWIRLIPHEKMIPLYWQYLCKHTHPAFLEFIQTYLESHPPSDLPDDAWMALSANPTATAWLHDRYPDQVWWNFVCLNPSPDVIPRIEAYVLSHAEEEYMPPKWSYSLAYSYHYDRILHERNQMTIESRYFKSRIHPTFLSIHPHALALLQKRPEWIDYKAISRRTDIWEKPQQELL